MDGDDSSNKQQDSSQTVNNSNNGQNNNSSSNSNNNNNRNFERNRGGPRGNFSPSKVECRYLVQSRDAGAIIGRGGSNIQNLRQKHKTMIQVPDCDGPERVLTISGELEACISTLQDILPTMRDNQRIQNDQSEIRLLIHQSQAGAVIGKGGDRVKELRQKFNVGMKVFVQTCPFSTERVVALRGHPEDIERCMREIYSILDQTPPRGPIHNYDPFNYDEYTIQEYGGFSDGQAMMNQQQGAQYGTPRGVRDGNYNQRYGVGGDYYMPPVGNGYNQGPRPLIDFDRRGGNYSQPVQTNQVTIPNELGSVIIGPRGTKISQIRQQSGASITLDDPTPGSNDRIITIIGTQIQINQAQYLLQMAVKESGMWNNNGNN
ncbi:unnamed protein product [Didymodactylos carnosus]|uniref:K Homology domain-containing protein n=1 Tax=Didymodactylos carnosus TaxID=1234261 RepID=A0A815DTT3_9BILA|nr:unnamed protein product [Didymodactylos carnosus]CAF1302529.1 unnamed protein product [Didymodactylos carnosus]CAF3627194.1 unnamed protein product [Didymodactylos carnosus]CAF4129260.1 unnamed protein product [Didymodactylos carnosus]